MKINEAIAVVTGGASGLGEAVVRNIVQGGGKAVILDLDVEKGKRLSEELENQAIFVKTDVADEESVRIALQEAVGEFGSINTVINCAGIGIAEKVIGKRGVHALDSFSKVIQINLVGTFNVIRLATEQMTNNEPNEHGERGVIINTASVAAFEGQIGQAAYSASKSGVVGLTLPIARELSTYGIRVMTIAPGLFDTPMLAALPEEGRKALGAMIPFPPRLGDTNEYAHLTQCIIENTMLNGEVIRLDGAIRMQPK